MTVNRCRIHGLFGTGLLVTVIVPFDAVKIVKVQLYTSDDVAAAAAAAAVVDVDFAGVGKKRQH